jgi:hypothetical protein
MTFCIFVADNQTNKKTIMITEDKITEIFFIMMIPQRILLCMHWRTEIIPLFTCTMSCVR